MTASAASTTEFEHIVERQAALQRARQVQNGAQLGQIGARARRAAHGPGLFVRAELVHQPLQLGAVQGEDELVGIREAKLDAVGIAQRVAFHALAVDDTGRAGCRHLQCVYSPSSAHDPGVGARDAAVAQDQVVVGLAADLEGQRRRLPRASGGRWDR